MDRCGTQTSVILHKFAKVPWLKLRRDNSVIDSDLKVACHEPHGHLGDRIRRRKTNTPEEEEGNAGNG